ncbi:MAG: BRCT domain-containing protein [Vicinamibacterales bacterium]
MPEDWNDWARQAAYHRNEFRRSAGQLVGIALGLMADSRLDDAEIQYLHDWLDRHDEVAYCWPGNIVHRRVKAVIADGTISQAEREYLIETLSQLVGEHPSAAACISQVTELAFDDVPTLTFPGHCFCLTGNFVYAPRAVCEEEVVKRGGTVKCGVSRKVRYLVVGSMGSPEWKHGSFGTKIQRAMDLKSQGAPIQIVREDVWANAL